ncbi:hypothetical protein [Streptomyces graminofaciens]|nr:hypothetical protein [Streptomyces graminofaciens]
MDRRYQVAAQVDGVLLPAPRAEPACSSTPCKGLSARPVRGAAKAVGDGN